MDWRNRSLVSPGRNIWLPSATLGYRESPSRSSSWRPAFGLLGRLGAKRSRSCAQNGTCDHRAVFRAAWRPKRAHRASPPVRLVRFRELLCGFDFDAFQGLYGRDRYWAASGDDCVFLCGRYAHWWYKDAGPGPVHSLCARGARCFGAAALPRAYITRQGGADAAPVLMLCQAMSNLRVRFRHISYGDQGLFIERDLFFKAGMFPDVPLMEDFQFALNLKRLGEPLGMAKHRIRTSARCSTAL